MPVILSYLFLPMNVRMRVDYRSVPVRMRMKIRSCAQLEQEIESHPHKNRRYEELDAVTYPRRR